MPGNPQIQVTGKMSLYLRSPCSGANWRRKNTITHPWQLLWWCPRLGRSEVCWWHGRHRSQGWRGGKLLVLWPHLHQKGGRQQEVQPRWRWRVQSPEKERGSETAGDGETAWQQGCGDTACTLGSCCCGRSRKVVKRKSVIRGVAPPITRET